MHPSHAPPPADLVHLVSGSLWVRAATAVFLFWQTLRPSQKVWAQAWLFALGLLVVNGLVIGARRQWPNDLLRIARSSMVADGLLGWGVAWAYNQAPHTAVPALLPLLTIEMLATDRGRRGVILAALYIVVTNGMMHWLPGTHHDPLWRWSRVVRWFAIDGLIWSALLVFGHIPLTTSPLTVLTAREREVYDLSLTGLTHAQIAARLQIEVSTVKSHVRHIHHKLGGALPASPGRGE
jgi:DNA-binding CsgD family transcriptional regulator